MKNTPKKNLAWITLSFMMVAAVASIRSLPSMAVFGLGSVSLYLLPALVFFVPVSLVGAELGTGWNGGIYGWIKQAFGERLGFFAMWFLWIQVVTWYPIVLAFAAGTTAYLFNPELAKNGLFTVVVINVLYWGSTLVALGGLSKLSKLSSWFMICGTLVPAATLIILGAAWLLTGHSSATPLTVDSLVPNIFKSVTTGHQKLHPGAWAEFTGILGGLVLIVSNFLAFAGIEMNAIHASSLANPQKQMPKAILIAAVLIVVIFVPPTLAISFVVPADSTSLTAGVMQAYADFFHQFHMDWAIKFMAALLIIGALGGVLSWTAGPSAGLLAVGKSGSLPLWWQVTNKNGVQKNILILQGVLVTVLSLIYVVVPDVSTAFWMLSAIAAQMYLIIYLFMFSAVLKLRKTQPNVKRGYKAPAVHFWAYLGIASSLFTFFLGFVPPNQYKTMSPVVYVAILIGGLLLFGLPPFIFYAYRKPEWQVISKGEADKYSAALQDMETEADDPTENKTDTTTK
ncbi:MAG: APC family permease [Flavobacterium sp.]